jgi:hypothetical protein
MVFTKARQSRARRDASDGASIRDPDLRLCQRGFALAPGAARAPARGVSRLSAFVRGDPRSADHGGSKGPAERSLLRRACVVEGRQLGSRLLGLAQLCLSEPSRGRPWPARSAGVGAWPDSSTRSRATDRAAIAADALAPSPIPALVSPRPLRAKQPAPALSMAHEWASSLRSFQ